MKPFQLYPKSLAHLACKSPSILNRTDEQQEPPPSENPIDKMDGAKT